MAFEQNIVTKRFIEIYENLVFEKRIKSATECAGLIGYDKSGLSHILKKKRDVPMTVLHRFILHYGIDPTYLFSEFEYGENLPDKFYEEREEIKEVKNYMLSKIEVMEKDVKELKKLVNRTL